MKAYCIKDARLIYYLTEQKFSFRYQGFRFANLVLGRPPLFQRNVLRSVPDFKFSIKINRLHKSYFDDTQKNRKNIN